MSAESSTGLKPPLAAYGVTWEFGGRRVLDEVSFELDRGRIMALIGPNGSGKSTLMKILSGVLGGGRIAPGRGEIRYRGTDFRAISQADRARHVAYVGPDLSAEFPLTAHEAVLLGRTTQGSALFSQLAGGDGERIREAMERCRCWELRDRALHSLSGGERQLVALARAFAQGASVLLLDEALSRMDLNHQSAIGRMLREQADRQLLSALLVSHDLNLAAEWADSCLLLQAGRKVADGPIRATLTEEQLRKLYPGVSLLVAPNPATGAPQVHFGR
jgi:iron complex transport system ATP-binding protein